MELALPPDCCDKPRTRAHRRLGPDVRRTADVPVRRAAMRQASRSFSTHACSLIRDSAAETPGIIGRPRLPATTAAVKNRAHCQGTSALGAHRLQLGASCWKVCAVAPFGE